MAENVLQAFLSDLITNPDNVAPKAKVTDSGQPYDLHNVEKGKRPSTVQNRKVDSTKAVNRLADKSPAANPYTVRSVADGSKKEGKKTQTAKGVKEVKKEVKSAKAAKSVKSTRPAKPARPAKVEQKPVARKTTKQPQKTQQSEKPGKSVASFLQQVIENPDNNKVQDSQVDYLNDLQSASKWKGLASMVTSRGGSLLPISSAPLAESATQPSLMEDTLQYLQNLMSTPQKNAEAEKLNLLATDFKILGGWRPFDKHSEGPQTQEELKLWVDALLRKSPANVTTRGAQLADEVGMPIIEYAGTSPETQKFHDELLTLQRLLNTTSEGVPPSNSAQIF